MLATMALPPFISRFIRPFTQTTRLSIAPDSSLPASFAPSKAELPANTQRLTVAAGCFWGTEHVYRKAYGGKDKGVLDAIVGYIGGDLSNPSYRQVCGGKTGREFTSTPCDNSSFY